MRELDRLRGFVLGQEHNFTDSQSADVHALLDLAEQRWAKLNARVMASMSAALLDTPEQPDPTAEALQEAADAAEAGEMDANQKLEIATAKYLASNGASPSAERVGPADGLEAVAAPVTIGSYSDVSDEDVRRAGGEPTVYDKARDASGSPMLAPNGSTNYDFGPKA